MGDSTPEQIAEFDQSLAEINTTLDVFINAYGQALATYGQAEAIMGAAAIAQKRAENVEALSQYLAVAVHRVWELQYCVLTLNQRYKELTGNDMPGVYIVATGNDWPPAN